MALSANTRTTGGSRLNGILVKAQAARGVNRITVGIQGGETYQDKDRTPVAMVGFWNNFGTDTIPARPFAQQGNAKIEQGIGDQIRIGIDGETMVVDAPWPTAWVNTPPANGSRRSRISASRPTRRSRYTAAGCGLRRGSWFTSRASTLQIR